MTDMEKAQARLEQLAVKHSPEQHLENGEVDCRYVTLLDEPGVYYLLDTDNGEKARKPGVRTIQLVFLDVPEHAVHYVEQLGAGWRLDKVEPIISKEDRPVWGAILSHDE
jgi:hypothetical protein